jgi:hypothetical protein
MRRFGYLLFALFFFSCAVQEKKEASPYQYTITKFVKTSKGCATDSLNCASYVVAYPVFENLSPAVSKIIMAGIDAGVTMGNPEADGWTMERTAEDFTKGYDSFRIENPEFPTGSWYYEADVKVETFVDTLLSLSLNEEYFTGGAHGGSGKFFINIHPKTGKVFTLDNLLKQGYQSELRKLAEKEFRINNNLADTASYINNGFEFPDNKFQINQNYGFTQQGIIFYYNSYEIAAYAQGPSQVIIPYEKIKDWLK